MSAKYVLAISVMIIASCGPAKVIQDYQRDSVMTIIKDTTIIRDSIIYVQIEAEKETAILPDIDTSRLSTRYAESEAYVSKGQLYHSLRNKSEALIPVEVKLPKVFHMETSTMIREKIETVEVEKQLSKWQRFIQALGYGLLVSILIWIARKFIKI